MVTTEERRRAYLKASLRSRSAFWAMFIGTAVSVVGGAAIPDPRVMAGGPLLTALAVFAIAYGASVKRAETEFFSELAPQLGLDYTLRNDHVPITPLLAAGDRRRFEHTMEGPLYGKLGGPRCLLGHYTFEMRQDLGDDMTVWRPYHFTICAIDVGEPLARFRGLYLQPRLSGLGLDHNWLSRAPKPEKVQLESVRFGERYELHRTRDQDELAVRELFSPSFVVWLSEHPLQPGFECKAGTLVVYIRGHEKSAGRMTLLHEAAREVTRRLGKQVEEGGSSAVAAAGRLAAR